MQYLSRAQEEQTGCIEVIRDCLEKGGVCLLPTETVYGLFCRCDRKDSVEKIFRLKNRDPQKRLQTFLSSAEQVTALNISPGPTAERMLQNFFPGPLTLVLFDKAGETHGIRIPDDPFLNDLVRACDFPLVATSANLSGEPAALSVSEALSSIEGQPDLVYDAGACIHGVASTVIAFTDTENTNWQVVRQGPITQLQIDAVMREPDHG